MRQLIVTADDFGRDVAINEAVEAAHLDGILSTASLMVGAPAAQDAIERARRLPALRVGLHLVLIDGEALSGDWRFDDNQLVAGLRYFFAPGIRRRLAAEIRAQFEAFCATGLTLDHVNAHKHMHLHPTVARLIVEIGRDYDMRAMRLPKEPAAPLRQAMPGQNYRPPAWRPAIGALRRRLQGTGLVMNDQLFGIAWSGAFTEEHLLALLPHLPKGVSELYCHPATRTTDALATAMPGYRHADELAALRSPRVRARIAELGIGLTSYGELAAAQSI